MNKGKKKNLNPAQWKEALVEVWHVEKAVRSLGNRFIGFHLEKSQELKEYII